MKLIIDIADKAYNRLLEEQHLPNRLDIEWVITHGTPIPDNATNGDAISREAVLKEFEKGTENLYGRIDALLSVQPSHKGQCKECKYFEYDSVAKVDGVPLIVAHEICNKWGDGCKTREDGYCFLFESADMRGDTE